MLGNGKKSSTSPPPAGTVDIAKAFAEGTPIDKALAKGVQHALRRHKMLGQSIAIWRDGKVVILPPEEIPCSEEDETCS